jgi:hypothetical protein
MTDKIEHDLVVLKWMLGVVLALSVGLFWLQFAIMVRVLARLP